MSFPMKLVARLLGIFLPAVLAYVVAARWASHAVAFALAIAVVVVAGLFVRRT